MAGDKADIAELCKRDFRNARRTVDSVKDLYTHFFRVLPTESKEDMLHSLTSLGIAIQEAITEISDPTRKYPHPYRCHTSTPGHPGDEAFGHQ